MRVSLVTYLSITVTDLQIAMRLGHSCASRTFEIGSLWLVMRGVWGEQGRVGERRLRALGGVLFAVEEKRGEHGEGCLFPGRT